MYRNSKNRARFGIDEECGIKERKKTYLKKAFRTRHDIGTPVSLCYSKFRQEIDDRLRYEAAETAWSYKQKKCVKCISICSAQLQAGSNNEESAHSLGPSGIPFA